MVRHGALLTIEEIVVARLPPAFIVAIDDRVAFVDLDASRQVIELSASPAIPSGHTRRSSSLPLPPPRVRSLFLFGASLRGLS
jgi:hypothetical protein